MKLSTKIRSAASVLLMLTLGLAHTAAAAPSAVIDSTRSASLTIHKYDLTAAKTDGVDPNLFSAKGEPDGAAESALSPYALRGVEFTYLKVGSLHTFSEDGNVRLQYDIPTALEQILGISSPDHQHTTDTLNTAMAKLLTEANTAGKNALEHFVRSGGTQLPETDIHGVSYANGLPLGLYLIAETNVPDHIGCTTDPFFVSLPMSDVSGDHWIYDVAVYPKNQTNAPVIDKLVKADEGVYGDSATASEGDTVNYLIISKLPQITSEATYLTRYEFKDTLSKGLKYVPDDHAFKIKLYENEADARTGSDHGAQIWDLHSGNFTRTIDSSTNQMTVTLTKDGLAQLNPNRSEQYLVVYYDAEMHSGDDVILGSGGNSNQAELTYSRTNTLYTSTTPGAQVNVCTYGLKIQKLFSDRMGDPLQVQFLLKNETDHYYMKAVGSDGTYYITDQPQNHVEEAKATRFTPNAQGILNINGLETGNYSLTEIHTDRHYSLLKEKVQFTVRDNTELTITNSRSLTLPQTGGLGTLLFTLVGAAAVTAGILLLVKGKRVSDET